MTIDDVRDAVSADQVRRLMDAAPSTDDLREAISDRLDAIGEGLETVAAQLGRPAPARRSRWPMVALGALVVGVLVALLATRIDRTRWAAVRDRAIAMTRRAPRPTSIDAVGDGLTELADQSERELHAIKIEPEDRVTSDEVPVGAASEGQA